MAYKRRTNIIFNHIDDSLTFSLKHIGLVNPFNGLDIDQTRDYAEVSC